MFEARIEMRLEPKLDYDVIMMTIDVSIDPVEPLEQLSDQAGKCLREGYTLHSLAIVRHQVHILFVLAYQRDLETPARCLCYSAPMS